MKRKTREKLKKQNGITLVALVVTIVVLLILAGISLNLVLGQNGIVAKSKEAKEKGTQDQENTETALNSLYNEMIGAINEDENPDEEEKPGEEENPPESLDWNAILADANANPEKYRHADQSSTNGDIGIGTDGQPVNLDLWNYKFIDNNTKIQLSTTTIEPGIVDTTVYHPGYSNENITSDGKIQGTVPQYVKKLDGSEFCPVTDMNSTFSGCTGLVIAPTIPGSVTSMESTFSRCTSLTTAPTIPGSVINLQHTFDGCKNLTIAPTIPSSVTNLSFAFFNCESLTTAPNIQGNVTDMTSTFYNCKSLRTPPNIPDSVKKLKSTFYNCASLSGEIIINANPSSTADCSKCFEGASTNEGTDLTVKGTSNLLHEIIVTKSSNSNIHGL